MAKKAKDDALEQYRYLFASVGSVELAKKVARACGQVLLLGHRSPDNGGIASAVKEACAAVSNSFGVSDRDARVLWKGIGSRPIPKNWVEPVKNCFLQEVSRGRGRLFNFRSLEKERYLPRLGPSLHARLDKCLCEVQVTPDGEILFELAPGRIASYRLPYPKPWTAVQHLVNGHAIELEYAVLAEETLSVFHILCNRRSMPDELSSKLTQHVYNTLHWRQVCLLSVLKFMPAPVRHKYEIAFLSPMLGENYIWHSVVELSPGYNDQKHDDTELKDLWKILTLNDP